MLSDEALRRHAEMHIPRVYGAHARAVVSLISDPSGAWIETARADRLDGALPFFISREDGSVVRFPRHMRHDAEAAFRQWVAGGAMGVCALYMPEASEPPLALREAWARAWLVHVPRYATLHVPTARELLDQMPELANLKLG